MKWRRGADSGSIEDRRGMRGGAMGAGAGGLGVIGVIIYLVMGALGGGGGGGGFGIDPRLEGFPGMNASPPRDPNAPDPDADLKAFVGFVLDDVQASWADTFKRAGQQYKPTTLVLFEQATQTGCGTGQSASGPFYCPTDSKVYLDLSFFRELNQRFGAPGDFAQAYVIAHELGHHVQHVLGISDQVHEMQQRDPGKANALSVRLELQADCLAGVWGYSARQADLLEPGDLEEGIDAAEAIGDDRLQKQGGGRVNPETWTHGSSAQRVEWFQKGFESGDSERCNTFA